MKKWGLSVLLILVIGVLTACGADESEKKKLSLAIFRILTTHRQ